jgi:hypothetical protein
VSLFRSTTTPRFWKLFRDLPAEVQSLALQKYSLFKTDPYHPSLGLKGKGEVWTVEIGRSYRAIAHRADQHLSWFWIGSHEAYNNVLRRVR